MHYWTHALLHRLLHPAHLSLVNYIEDLLGWVYTTEVELIFESPVSQENIPSHNLQITLMCWYSLICNFGEVLTAPWLHQRKSKNRNWLHKFHSCIHALLVQLHSCSIKTSMWYWTISLFIYKRKKTSIKYPKNIVDPWTSSDRKKLEKKHWMEMIENPRRPIIHWHVLKVIIFNWHCLS